MLFTKSKPGIFSPKERNLYAKIFAGYLFNEFILTPSLEERLGYFLDITPVFESKRLQKTSIRNLIDNQGEFNLANSHVNFDNHLISKKNKEDRGEFSDIAIWLEKPNKTFHLISIEAKYTSNWTIKKDIETNIDRIKKVTSKNESYIDYNTSSATFLLLLPETKINEQNRNAFSLLNRLITMNIKIDNSIPFGIITWESIIESIIKNDKFSNVSCIYEYYQASHKEMELQNRFRKRI